MPRGSSNNHRTERKYIGLGSLTQALFLEPLPFGALHLLINLVPNMLVIHYLFQYVCIAGSIVRAYLGNTGNGKGTDKEQGNVWGRCHFWGVVCLSFSFLNIHSWSYGAEFSPRRTQNEFFRQSSKLSSAFIIVRSLSVVLSLLYILPLTPPVESTEGSDLLAFKIIFSRGLGL